MRTKLYNSPTTTLITKSWVTRDTRVPCRIYDTEHPEASADLRFIGEKLGTRFVGWCAHERYGPLDDRNPDWAYDGARPNNWCQDCKSLELHHAKYQA